MMSGWVAQVTNTYKKRPSENKYRKKNCTYRLKRHEKRHSEGKRITTRKFCTKTDETNKLRYILKEYTYLHVRKSIQ